MFNLFISFILLSVPLAVQATDYHYRVLTESELAKIHDRLDNELAKTHHHIQRLINEMSAVGGAFGRMLEIQLAITAAEVKATLIGNFRHTKSLRSPLVREKLLLLLEQDEIAMEDLLALQKLVAEEKQKLEL